MEQLRDKEKGCEWDKEQDFKSIAPFTIEEAYEVGRVKKQQLINAKRAYIIHCEATGKTPERQYCLTCGHTVTNI